MFAFHKCRQRMDLSMRRCWLIRHAASSANAGAVTSDTINIPLSEAGRTQALSNARALPRRPELIVVSSFLRARQTAEPTMSRFPDVPVETWPV